MKFKLVPTDVKLEDHFNMVEMCSFEFSSILKRYVKENGLNWFYIDGKIFSVEPMDTHADNVKDTCVINKDGSIDVDLKYVNYYDSPAEMVEDELDRMRMESMRYLYDKHVKD